MSLRVNRSHPNGRDKQLCFITKPHISEFLPFFWVESSETGVLLASNPPLLNQSVLYIPEWSTGLEFLV